MGKALAAYDIGLSTLRIQFWLRYNADEGVHDVGGIDDAISCIQDSLIVLSKAAHEVEPIRGLASLLREFECLCKAIEQGTFRTNADDPSETGENNLRRCWARLAAASRTLFLSRPLLHHWYALGRAVGFCYQDCLSPGCVQISRGLPKLLQVLTTVPSRVVERYDILKRLNYSQFADGSGTPFTDGSFTPLLLLIDISPAHFIAARPFVTPWGSFAAIPINVQRDEMQLGKDIPAFSPLLYEDRDRVIFFMYKISHINQEIRSALALEADRRVDIVKGATQSYVVLDNVAYQINEHGALILKEIIDGGGAYISSTSMKKRYPVLESANFDKQIKQLPEPIHQYLDPKKGKGTRWIVD